MFEGSKVLEAYTPEQALLIKEYAAGLLVSWTKVHIDHLISPDVGDGFDAPEGVFPTAEKEWEAHGAVLGVLDEWLADTAVQAGFRSVDDIVESGYKYPPLHKEQ